MFKQTLIAIALMGATTVHAQDNSSILDEDVCEKAVKYSFKYMPEEDDAKLHEARWAILKGDRADSMQKLVGMVIFELGQRLGYAFDPETMGSDEWWEETVDDFNNSCEGLLGDLRDTYGYGKDADIESANPDEAW